MIKLYDLIEKKPQPLQRYQTTVVSSPLRGQNQDQSGYGVKNNVADYTISDSVGTTDYAKGSKNRPVNSDISVGAPQTNRTLNAPSSSSASQSSATSRAAKMMKMQINRDKSQVDISRKEISLRKHNEKVRDQQAEKIKNNPVGSQFESYVRSDVNTKNTYGHDDPSDSAAARITGVSAKQPAPKKPIKTPLPPKDPKAKQKANPEMTKQPTIPESRTYITFADFVKVSESNIAEARRVVIIKEAAKDAARRAGVKMPTPKKPAKENPIKLREDEQIDEAKEHDDDDEKDVKVGSGKFAVDLRKRPIGDYHRLTFANGETRDVPIRHVAKANKMMANAPKPSDKKDIQDSLYHSHKRFMQTVDTGKAIKDPKRGISLGGSAKIGGSKE